MATHSSPCRRFVAASRRAWVAVLMLAGCSTDNRPEVTVYVAVDRAAAEPILQQFEAESGIRVQALYDAEAAKTTGLVTRLMAEAQRPRCDVFWNNELAQTLLLARQGLLAPYRPENAAEIPDVLRAGDGTWTGIATRARVIVYNTQYVSADEAPRSLFDLTDPKWRGKVAMADPQFGTTRTHVAALFAELGPQRAQKFFEDLLENEVRIVDGNAMVKNLVARAHPEASPIYVGLTDTDDVLAGQAEGAPIAMLYPDGDSLGTLLVPSTVCLVRDAPRPEQARRLIDYLVGPAVEQRLTGQGSGFFPVRPSESTDAARLTAPQRSFQITPAQLLQQLEPSSRWTRQHFHP